MLGQPSGLRTSRYYVVKPLPLLPTLQALQRHPYETVASEASGRVRMRPRCPFAPSPITLLTLVSLRYAIISAGPPVKLQFRAIAIVQQRCASSECALAVFYKRRRAKERY